MRNFVTDLRYGLRMLLKHPGLATISVTALALGIGLTAMMWSIVYGALMRDMPFERGQDLVYVRRYRPDRGPNNNMSMPVHDYEAYRAGQHAFEDMASWYEGTVNVSGIEGRPERFTGGFITPSAFRLLRLPPRLGRAFTDDDNKAGAPNVAMISWDLWQERFGGDSAIIGKTLRANGISEEIVGVMPRGFLFPNASKLWLPLRMNATTQQPWASGTWLESMGRLKPGATIAQVRAELGIVAARLAQEHPKENTGIAPLVQTPNQYLVPEGPRTMLWTMLGAVFGVLLLACSNVANLLLARAAMRSKEVAIRTALGASRARVIGQLLTEALVISLIGSVIGIGIAAVGVRWFNHALLQTQLPFWVKITVDPPILLFVLLVSVLAAVISGVVPALQATNAKIHDVLKDEGRGSSSLRLGRFSKGLVVLELALAGGLLVAAGFMIQSVIQRSHFDYGVRTSNVLTARAGLFETTYPDSASHAKFWRDLEVRMQQLPANNGAALMTALPGLFGGNGGTFAVEGKTYATDRDYPETRSVAVSPSYFALFKLQSVEGRLLTENDNGATAQVAVVTRGFALKHFPGQSPLGKRLRFGDAESTQPWLTIVGVIPDVWYDGTNDTPARTVVLTSIYQGDYRFLSIAIGAPSNPTGFTGPLQMAVLGVDRDQPVYFVRTLDEAIAANGWFYTVFGDLFASFGAAALFLAMIGVYGVMSFAVTRRTPEIGVRMALGAGTKDVLRLFLQQGTIQIAIGLLLGAALAFGISRGLTSVLFQVDINNGLMYGGVSAALALSGFVAILIPSLRATRVDPLSALRYD
ncbi:MAG TPA: ABC transporter permease [Gemmatimonadales bacterium]|jgi:predicted permease